MDYSKYSDEELEKIANGRPESSNQGAGVGGFLKNAGNAYLNYAGGALRGTGQAVGDLGASAINWPISGIEHLTGKKLPHVPHPDLINKNPGSLSESIGQNVGQLFGGLGLPGGVGMKAAQYANKGYQAWRHGKQLPLIAKLLAAGAGGAIEGAAGNEENRKFGAELGAGLGAFGHAIPASINFANSIKSKNIAKNIKNESYRIGKHFEERFNETLLAGEKAGANDFLKAEKANLKILKKAGEGKLAYGIEKFNENPTLKNAHKAQSDLNKIASKYKSSKEGSLEASVYDEALKLKNRLLTKISDSFEKSGAKHHGESYKQTRVDFAKEAAPYLHSAAIKGLLGKNKRNVATIRPGQFADKLLQEEDFLAQAGKNHPDLLRREKFNAIKKNPLAQGAALGAAGLATGFLPHFVSKALGLK